MYKINKNHYILNTIYLIIIFLGVISTLLINPLDKSIFLIPTIIAIILLVINVINTVVTIKKQYSDMYGRFRTVEDTKEAMIEKLPNGIAIININGIIEYVNPALGIILGAVDIVGRNVMHYDKVKKTNIYLAILLALKGEATDIKHQKYKLGSSGENKILNLNIFPEKSSTKNKIEKIIVVIQDVTEEYFLKKKVEKNYLDTIEALASLVDAKDSYTWEHSKNVSNYVSMICAKLNLPVSEKEKIELSASFHDIGKIGICDFILNKNGPLTDEEFSTIKKHPEIGADVIRKINGFEEGGDIIRHHHERWDGKGYPYGLKGNEIPYGSQIIAIADTFDAITSDRVYRNAKGIDKAIQILKEERGKQFNSELVDVFLSVIGTEIKE